MTHTEQTKECAYSRPFIIGELEIADFVSLCLVLFIPVELVDEVIDTL
jgi:hypothetical protein